ncbi:THAP domain-containing protein 1-like [Colias croceus]|uniref:THAP domain-containing protein 1-like n=1 Tax=Colias crocea TaxID=72248 RepID=UPI001E2814E7|nr:THAP domain-containing protein 1-like [Colias croceus]
MPSCSVFSCKKRSKTSSLLKDNVTFHLFPKYAMFRHVWIQACGNHTSWTPKRTSTICSEHFDTTCFIKQSNNRRRLKQDAVPTLKLPKDKDNEPEPGTFSPKIIKVETLGNSSLPQIQVFISTQDQTHTAPPENRYPQLTDSPINAKLKNTIRMKNIKIKQLQAQIRYLKQKYAEMKELVNEFSQAER